MSYHTDIVTFKGALISKILIFGGALFREGRLSESGCSLDHLQYALIYMLAFEAQIFQLL